MLYLRFLFVIIWLPTSFGIGLIHALLRWGNLDVNRWTSRLFGIPVLKVLGLKLVLENPEELEKHQPCVYVVNHQSAVDIASFGSIYPHNTVVLAKKELRYIPVLNVYFVAAGNVLVDRQNRSNAVANLAKAVATVKRKKASIWIFAEGTRNRTEEVMLPLKKGAFYMAMEAGLPIVPVVSCRLKKIVDWDRKMLKGGTIRMKVLPPVPTQGLSATDIERLAVEVREKMVEAILSLSV